MVENKENLATDITHIEIDQLPLLRHLTYEGGHMFDGLAQRYASMSGEAFLRA